MTKEWPKITYIGAEEADPVALERLYDEYMYFDKHGVLDVASPEVEEQGVVHMGRKADWFREQMTQRDCLFEYALFEGELLGFSMYYMGDTNSSSPTVRDLAARSGGSTSGYLYLVCVARNAVRRGLGRTLVYRTMAMFKASDVKQAVCEIACKPKVNRRSSNLFKKAGWDATGRIEDHTAFGKVVSYESFEWRPSENF